MSADSGRFIWHPEGWMRYFPTQGPLYSGYKIAEINFSPGESICIGRGTDADRSLIQDFLDNCVPPDEHKKWRAGHLISRSFGGSGTDERNIVPLTTKANGMHTAVEWKVAQYQSVIFNYFFQKRVRQYCNVLPSLSYVVEAQDMQNYGYPQYIAYDISYYHRTRGDWNGTTPPRDSEWSAEDDGWGQWRTIDANTLLSMINADWKQICDAYGYVMPIGVFEDDPDGFDNVH